ncbi:MAG TPA: TauD/TfdA family dioxygenase [Gammaproteobacteria bacterium]|nr:TauD/TfdA family dioxygenase [Gammaproteobacteria bacterium]
MTESPANSPFDLDNDAAYRAWRERKLAGHPAGLGGLVVEVRDPRHLSEAEHAALLDRLRRANMALYAGPADPDRAIPLELARRFGATRLDDNWLSDDDGLSSLTVAGDGTRTGYIPYTDRPIRWHTDGYYNAPDRQIHALLLHCVRPAAAGGENALMDHEVAYILLRDRDPGHVRALMGPDVLTIPEGTEADGSPRPARTGPVFSVDPATGDLHMRYTARKHNAQWKDDPAVREAVQALEAILEGDSPYIVRGRLEAGMGLISNNVLHDRAGFSDDPDAPRLLYRGRFFDRLAGTGVRERPA